MIHTVSLFHSQVRNLLRLTVICLLLLNISPGAAGQDVMPVKIGIFTDCQYCNCPADEKRQYMLSLSKLDSCIAIFNSHSLHAVFQLGDMIDHDYASFDSVIPRFRQFKAPLYLVLGNHDYMIKKKFKPFLLDRLGMAASYYIVDIDNWRFIVLNGDDLSFFAPQDPNQRQERNDIVYDRFQKFELNGMPWNGGIGKAQMSWLEKQLENSENGGLNVVVLCHFPLFAKGNHNLFNNQEVFSLISRYASVKAYFNGHYHAGSYTEKEGIHLVNFKGMVDTKRNAFSLVTLTSDSILIKGYGREPDRNLFIRRTVEKQKMPIK
jgi:manganese-dependent ADP-ribose/CDP-alcohol diphosphatase